MGKFLRIWVTLLGCLICTISSARKLESFSVVAFFRRRSEMNLLLCLLCLPAAVSAANLGITEETLAPELPSDIPIPDVSQIELAQALCSSHNCLSNLTDTMEQDKVPRRRLYVGNIRCYYSKVKIYCFY
jgi:hypothetical protein